MSRMHSKIRLPSVAFKDLCSIYSSIYDISYEILEMRSWYSSCRDGKVSILLPAFCFAKIHLSSALEKVNSRLMMIR